MSFVNIVKGIGFRSESGIHFLFFIQSAIKIKVRNKSVTKLWRDWQQGVKIGNGAKENGRKKKKEEDKKRKRTDIK